MKSGSVGPTEPPRNPTIRLGPDYSESLPHPIGMANSCGWPTRDPAAPMGAKRGILSCAVLNSAVRLGAGFHGADAWSSLHRSPPRQDTYRWDTGEHEILPGVRGSPLALPWRHRSGCRADHFDALNIEWHGVRARNRPQPAMRPTRAPDPAPTETSRNNGRAMHVGAWFSVSPAASCPVQLVRSP